MPRSISCKEFEDYQRQREEPVEDGDIDGQRQKINAIFWVAYCFFYGTGGVECDRGAASNLLEQIIREQDIVAGGNSGSMTGKHRCLLAIHYAERSDDARAEQLYREAVPLLQAEAQVVDGLNLQETAWYLGYCFLCGFGVEKDHEQVKFWWKQPAEMGKSGPRRFFELHFFCSYCGEQERKEILDWWLKLATEQEHPWAQYCLGKCHREGTGLEKDLVRAVEWYDKAIAHYGTRAIHSKHDLLASLDADEHIRVLGCVKRNKNIKKANHLIEQLSERVPLALWPFALGAFQREDNPPWEAPSPTFLVLRAVAHQLTSRFPIPKKRVHSGK